VGLVEPKELKENSSFELKEKKSVKGMGKDL
jgi:hypothetical protein